MIFLLNLKEIKGNIFNYPIEFDNIIEGRSIVSRKIDNQDNLINFIYDRWKKDEIEKTKSLSQICLEVGLFDTVNLFDLRTISLIKLYKYYNSNSTPPAPFNYKIWFDTVLICEQYFNTKIGFI